MRNCRYAMPSVIAVLGAFLCVACAPSSQVRTYDAADPRGSDVVRVEGARFAAMTSRDYAALDTLLADDLAYTHSSGETDTKTSLVAALREGRLVYVAIAPRDLRVTMLGADAAMISGRSHMSLGGPTPRQLDIRFVDVLARRNGRWQTVLWQSTRLQ